MSASLSPSERSYILTGLAHPTEPTRLDGRQLLEPRAISLEAGIAPQANGSARVVLAEGTEVVAGIKLEVVELGPGESWRGSVEVDVTPQAYPALQQSALQLLSTQFATVLQDHFMPSVPALPIVAPKKYFVPHLHLTLLSASSGSVLSALVLAARTAFADLRVPRIKQIGWEAVSANIAEGELDTSGIKGAIRAGKGGKKVNTKGEEWDLDLDVGDGAEYMAERKQLPVVVTLNLVPGSGVFFLDASPQEEAACPDRLHVFFTGSGKVCGLRLDGPAGIETERVPALLREAQKIASSLVESLNGKMKR